MTLLLLHLLLQHHRRRDEVPKLGEGRTNGQWLFSLWDVRWRCHGGSSKSANRLARHLLASITLKERGFLLKCEKPKQILKGRGHESIRPLLSTPCARAAKGTVALRLASTRKGPHQPISILVRAWLKMELHKSGWVRGRLWLFTTTHAERAKLSVQHKGLRLRATCSFTQARHGS